MTSDLEVVATEQKWTVYHYFLFFFLIVFYTSRFMFSSQDARSSPIRPVLSSIGRYFKRYESKEFLYLLAH